jgi:hypothetical protein
MAQTYQNLEVIIVDDASTDDTPEVISTLSAEDERVRAIRNSSPLGGAGARNRGLAEARGRYTAFLDDDDEWLPEKIERQVLFAAEYAYVGCRAEVSYWFAVLGLRVVRQQRESSGGQSESVRNSIYSLGDIYTGKGHAPPTVFLANTHDLRAIHGFDESLVGSQGYDLCVRMAKEFGAATIVEAPLAKLHQAHGLQRISDSPAHREGGWQTFAKHAGEMPRAGRRWRLCLLCLRECKAAEGFGQRSKWFLKALMNVDPLRPLTYFQLFVRTLLLRPFQPDSDNCAKR